MQNHEETIAHAHLCLGPRVIIKTLFFNCHSCSKVLLLRKKLKCWLKIPSVIIIEISYSNYIDTYTLVLILYCLLDYTHNTCLIIHSLSCIHTLYTIVNCTDNIYTHTFHNLLVNLCTFVSLSPL